MSVSSHFVALRLTIFTALVCSTGPVMAAPIGEATAAKNQVTGQLGQVSQQILIGSNVSSDETVLTGTSSSAELRFLDSSNLTIGAGSIVVLDRHIYDPNRGSVDSLVEISKGAMRFVSAGRRTNNFIIDTPSATVGIRGTDVTSVVQFEDATFALRRGKGNVCPKKRGQQATQEFNRACLEGNAALLPCGFYEIESEEEQKRNSPPLNGRKNDEDANFLVIPLDCAPGVTSNVSNTAINTINAQVAAGGPVAEIAALATTSNFAPLAGAPLIGGAATGGLAAVGAYGVSNSGAPPLDLPPERCVTPPCPCLNPPCNEPTTPPGQSLINFNNQNGPQSSFRE